MNFSDLPDDSVTHILGFLNLADARKVNQVDKRLKGILSEPLLRLHFLIEEAKKLHQAKLSAAEEVLAKKIKIQEQENQHQAFSFDSTSNDVAESETLVNQLRQFVLPLPSQHTLSDIDSHLRNDPTYARQLFSYVSIVSDFNLLCWFANHYQLAQQPSCLHYFLENHLTNANTHRVLRVLVHLGAIPSDADANQSIVKDIVDNPHLNAIQVHQLKKVVSLSGTDLNDYDSQATISDDDEVQSLASTVFEDSDSQRTNDAMSVASTEFSSDEEEPPAKFARTQRVPYDSPVRWFSTSPLAKEPTTQAHSPQSFTK